MIDRQLEEVVFSEEWGRQMRFIVGPRQCGKTTLAKEFLRKVESPYYYLWDSRKIRARYKDNELFFTEDAGVGGKNIKWVCFDEIHKYPKWKNVLKGVFDQVSENYRFIVTGSAKLDIIKRAGDSLAGRYFAFHLYPLMLREVAGSHLSIIPDGSAEDYLISLFDRNPGGLGDDLEAILTYGGFPEPFVSQNVRFHRKWQNDYIETVIKEDIGTLTRIIDREYIYDLYGLLPTMVGSPISESSLASHIQVSPPTVKNYLRRLEDFYLAFAIRPYSKNIKRSLLKAAKYYLYDWSQIKNQPARFENYVAVELKSMLSLWCDSLGVPYSLFYIRTKDRKESDFLIVKDGTPWMIVEAKSSDGRIEKHHLETAKVLGGIPVVQVCRQSGVLSQQGVVSYRVSADRFFA